LLSLSAVGFIAMIIVLAFHSDRPLERVQGAEPT
jgi:hypothetical protein